MTNPARRTDRRGAATRAALIECAETLFAERGVEGTSLREIGGAIGAANVNAVLYHFGSKEALIAATISHRLPKIDARRAELLQAAQAAAKTTGNGPAISDYLNVLFRPLFEQTNAEGRHSYIAFLHSLHRGNSLSLFAALTPEYPATLQAVELIRAQLGLPADTYRRRLQIAFAMIAAAVRMIDLGAEGAPNPHIAYTEALAMAHAALGAEFEG